MTTQRPIVTIKVGGSLFSLPDLSGRLIAVVRKLEEVRPLIVCGGGEAADIVRRWQPVHGLTDEQSHWLALRAVSLNELLLSNRLPDAAIVESRAALPPAWSAATLPILAVEAFVRSEESAAPHRLPHDWTATSDSIAAWTARVLGAERVLLCKSCDIDPHMTLGDAAARSLVDAHFPNCAVGLGIDWVNLRSGDPRVIRWQQTPEAGSEGAATFS